MLDKLAKPTLLDFLYVAHNSSAQQRETYRALTGRDYDADSNAAGMYSTLGPRWVYPDANGDPICIGGFQMITPGVWQDWLLTRSDAWEKHAKSITQVCRATIKLMLDSEAHRVQAISHASRTDIHAWYRLIGYEYEGTLRAFGANGDDFVMYARVR